MGMGNDVKIEGVIKGVEKMKNKEIQINIDLRDKDLQQHLNKPSKDPIYNKFLELEKKELRDKILSDKAYKDIILNGNLKFDLNDIGITDIDNINPQNLKENILKNEETERVMEYKILDEIKNIKRDNEQHKIKYLTILLIGKKGIGKTTLINYIFGVNEDVNQEIIVIKNDNFISYTKKNFPLKIIEFKGIGYDQSNNIEQIANKAFNCIKEQISKNKMKNYNEFIHCIWYLISGVRIGELEENLLKRLRNAYKDKNIPIIAVYNQKVKDSAIIMKRIITNKFNDITFTEVMPVDNKIVGSNIDKASFGGKELKEKTLKKCSQALESDLIELMTTSISESVKNGVHQRNKKIEEDINKNIEYEINEFKTVLTDEELKEKIVNLFQSSIYYFYKGYNDKISNQTIKQLNQSSIIKCIENFINYYKPKFENIIKSKIDEISQILINEQANTEKSDPTNYNMRVEFKRNLDKFKETTNVYFKRNYYYIAQKYIFIKLNETVFKKFFECYRKRLDKIVNNLLNDKNQKDIIHNLEKCFLTKLKDFAQINDVNIIIDDVEINKKRHSEIDKSQINLELPPAIIRNNSIQLIDNFDINFNDIKENNQDNETPQHDENNWYIYRNKKWKYLKEKTALDLSKFLEDNMVYQEGYFEQKKDEQEVLKLLKEYEKSELLKFFNQHYKYFIKTKICQEYNCEYILVNRNIISNIVLGKLFEKVYIKKLNNIIENINSDPKFCMIKYLTIVVIGRSGVGKSTLINGMIKEDKALTDIGDKVTKVNTLYYSKFIPFLRLYDTRGIELDEQYGPKSILDNALSIINESETKKDFNDYVNCIWYCVTDNYIDDKEIEIIRDLRNKKPYVPLIFVYSYAILQEGYNTVKSKVLEELKDAIIIPVLAKKADSYNSFGLDNLLDKTIELCKKELIKGKIYHSMRKQLSNYIGEIFKTEHQLSKIKVINYVANNFVNKFTKVLNKENLFNYIYSLFGNLLMEYLSVDNLSKENEKNLSFQNSLKDITNIKAYLGKFINHYQIKTKELVDKIKDQKALEFIDKQVYFEKKKTQTINKINKCNIDDFVKIIEDFLNDNFHYISQKYIIYRIITEPCEEICDNIEFNANNLVNNLLHKKSSDFLQKIYTKKFEDFEKRVNSFRINNRIYWEIGNNLNPTSSGMVPNDYCPAPIVIPNL